MCEPNRPTITPAGRINNCVACGEPLELEMEFDRALCVDCLADVTDRPEEIREEMALLTADELDILCGVTHQRAASQSTAPIREIA